MANPQCLDVAQPITPQNRDQKIRELFGDDWLIDYIDGKTPFSRLNAEQKTIATALDGVIVGMLDGNVRDRDDRNLTSVSIKHAIDDDGWVDRGEWTKILNTRGIYAGSGEVEKIEKFMRQMGGTASTFNELTAGIVSGFVDEERNGGRYSTTEIEAFLSPRASELLDRAAASSVAMRFASGNSSLEKAINNMEQLCAEIETLPIRQCEHEGGSPLAQFRTQQARGRN